MVGLQSNYHVTMLLNTPKIDILPPFVYNSPNNQKASAEYTKKEGILCIKIYSFLLVVQDY